MPSYSVDMISLVKKVMHIKWHQNNVNRDLLVSSLNKYNLLQMEDYFLLPKASM